MPVSTSPSRSPATSAGPPGPHSPPPPPNGPGKAELVALLLGQGLRRHAQRELLLRPRRVSVSVAGVGQQLGQLEGVEAHHHLPPDPDNGDRPLAGETVHLRCPRRVAADVVLGVGDAVVFQPALGRRAILTGWGGVDDDFRLHDFNLMSTTPPGGPNSHRYRCLPWGS